MKSPRGVSITRVGACITMGPDEPVSRECRMRLCECGQPISCGIDKSNDLVVLTVLYQHYCARQEHWRPLDYSWGTLNGLLTAYEILTGFRRLR